MGLQFNQVATAVDVDESKVIIIRPAIIDIQPVHKSDRCVEVMLTDQLEGLIGASFQKKAISDDDQDSLSEVFLLQVETRPWIAREWWPCFLNNMQV